MSILRGQTSHQRQVKVLKSWTCIKIHVEFPNTHWSTNMYEVANICRSSKCMLHY